MRRILLVFLILIMYGIFDKTAHCRAEAIAVIVNQANPVNELPISQIARIYEGKQQNWPDGKQIVAVNRPIGSNIRRIFYRKVLNSEPTRKFYDPGSPTLFKTFMQKSDIAVMRFISNMPEAIGYVLMSELKKQDIKIKIIAIIE